MKKIAILGTGEAGQAIGTKLVDLGFEVIMGSHMASGENANAWASAKGENAHVGSFADAATFGDIIFNCTRGEAVHEVMGLAGAENFTGKTIIDISNPLDFSTGRPSTLISSMVNSHSLGEELQKLLPKANVVKTLNMVNCDVMVNPAISENDPTMFVCGNNPGAKAEAIEFLMAFGWSDIVDLGDISASRALEMMTLLWLRIRTSTNNSHFAFKVLR